MSETPEISVEEMLKRRAKKAPTNGRGAGIWLASSGLVLFAFDAYCRLSGPPMWAFRVTGLLCLLLGALGIGMSFEKPK